MASEAPLYLYLTSTNSSTLSAIYSKVLVQAGTYPHLELIVLVDVHGERENAEYECVLPNPTSESSVLNSKDG